MTLSKKMEELGFAEYINCYLVTKGVREGFLYQMIDYNEDDINSPITKKKLELIKKYFPTLIQTPNTLGVLLSNKQFTLNEIEDSTSLGQILGFPCESYDEINPKRANDSEPTYTVHIEIELTNEKTISIISFLCLKIDKKKKKLEELITKIKKALIYQ